MSEQAFGELVRLMARLRGPGGCPWDREQTAQSLRTYLLEEAYEVLDAIERDDAEALRDELGDLLLQIIFHAQIARELDRFSIDGVLTQLHEKLIRRHPHVFGAAEAKSPEQVKLNWEALKAAERAAHQSGDEGDGSVLGAVSRNLPALLETYQLTRRAAQVGFDWERVEDVFTKLEEERSELQEELTRPTSPRVEEEVGDLLFAVANIARFLHIDPEIALRNANRKFVQRFQAIERELARQGKRPGEATLAEMDALWERSKGMGPGS